MSEVVAVFVGSLAVVALAVIGHALSRTADAVWSIAATLKSDLENDGDVEPEMMR